MARDSRRLPMLRDVAAAQEAIRRAENYRYTSEAGPAPLSSSLLARGVLVYPYTLVASSSLACPLVPFCSWHSSRFVPETTQSQQPSSRVWLFGL